MTQAPSTPRTGAQRAARWLFVLAVVAHLTALYWPRPINEQTGLPVDKVVHALIFGGVLVAGVRAGVRAGPLALLLALHAPLSEVVQSTLLARDGDVRDALADLVGVGLGWLLVVRPGPWRPGRGRTGSSTRADNGPPDPR